MAVHMQYMTMLVIVLAYWRRTGPD